jgi:hypothetical protein
VRLGLKDAGDLVESVRDDGGDILVLAHPTSAIRDPPEMARSQVPLERVRPDKHE